MQDLIPLLICAYLASLGFLRLRRFYTAPLSHLQGSTVSSQAVRFSVIIPARNEEQRLGPLLESLQNQTFTPYEVIVVDDGSTDETAVLARRFGCRVVQPADTLSAAQLEAPGDPRWTGKSAACYAGALEARGDLLVFFDADVTLAPDALEYLACYSRPGSVLSVQPYHAMKRAYEQCSLYFNLVAILGLDLGQWRHPFETKLGFFWSLYGHR
ncbi:glycosyltransferase family A protein [Gracilinema caldarium]|uniref:glycosyltransferase family 2 protein n=1 Tax=Gracilinema caldarium TaxID=215591 RepID=UPI0026E92E84|nr:glycosyltransferase family A protein [Gracilinema caldarium]